MGDLSLICPLCCNKIFNSKEALIEHLSAIIANLFCPVCNIKVSSLQQLFEHLNLDNCMPIDPVPVQTILFDSSENNEYESENSTQMEFRPHNDDNTNTGIDSDNNYTHIEMVDTGNSGDVNKMQIDLMKCLQTQELKVVKQAGENRYIIVSGDHTGLNQEDLVTKQNKDGTVSFTSIKDIKAEADLVAEIEKDEVAAVVQEYSCSTCQMSFTSVFDHITNYHTDQDVVIEGNIGNISSAMPNVRYETVDAENVSSQTPRRVITDTGDIVESPQTVKPTTVEKTQLHTQATDKTVVGLRMKQPKKQTTDKTGKGAKRYVQVDKLCDSVIKDLKEPDVKIGPCHRVVLTQSAVTSDGEPVKLYHCTSCSMYGSQLSDFRTQSCKAARYACSHCSVVYDNAKSLCAHMKVHKTKSDIVRSDLPETYMCEICCTVFLTNKSLKLHKRMHEPIKSRPIDPPRNSISGDNRYRCSICNKMIPDDYREIHKASHENDKMLNCGICNKKFTSTEYLEMHMNVHNLEKAPQNKSDKTLPYSCIYCDRKFARPHEKVKHERIHTGEKPHECEICGKSFRVSYCLTLHMRTHTGARPYACPHCDKRFKAHSVYNHHLLTHSEKRGYKCPYCPKAFKTSVQLAGHKNSHTKPFSCTQCNRPFASLYAVRVHTETHNRQNNLKFKCSLCGASYARAFALKDHVKQVHKQDIDNLDPDLLEMKQEKDKQDDTNDPLTGTDGWMGKAADADKDLASEITDLEMTSDEFIVPN